MFWEGFWAWATVHHFYAFVFMLIVLWTTFEVSFGVLVRLPNRIIRHLNIRKHGWPPEHCDADGDFKSDNFKGNR